MIQLNQIGVGNRITFISDDEIKAGIFLDEDGNGILTVKNSGSEKNGVSLARTANANFTHNYIVNGTTNLYVTGAGDGNITVTADSNIFTAEQITEIKTMFTGKMDDQNGYIVKEIDLLYKLIIWGKIDHSYTRTVRPFVIFEGIQNTNNATEILNYKLPLTTITANKATVTLTTDCLAVIWSDGTVVDNQSIETSRTGAGLGDFYLFGDYTKLVASNQSISSVDRFSNNLVELDLNRNSGLNIQNSYFDDISNLEILNLGGCNNSKVDSILSKLNLTYLNLGFTDSIVTNVDNHTNLTYLNLSNTDSLITKVSDNVNLTYINLSTTYSIITSVQNNLNLIYLYLQATQSIITSVSDNVNLEYLNLAFTQSIITSVSDNVKLIYLHLASTDSTLSIISNNINLIYLYLYSTKTTISNVSNNAKLKYLFLNETNSSTENINSVIQNLVDNNSSAGTRVFSFNANAAINQTNIHILVNRGWDVTQL